MLDKLLRNSNEIVEDILLFLESSGFVPFFTVLRATSHVNRYPDPTQLEPGWDVRVICRLHADGKASVSIHHRRMAAVEFDSLPGRHKERHPRPILRTRKEQPCFILTHIDGRLGRF